MRRGPATSAGAAGVAVTAPRRRRFMPVDLGAARWEDAVVEAHDEHVLPLESLGLVHSAEPHG